MEKVLENYGPYMTHLKQLGHTDSQLKNMMHQLSPSLPCDKHNPVKVTRHWNEFTW